ncbi:MAG TPA: universal stress protein [Nitrososphaeraceae archaeon]|nr:universal stress protein [Nitrososphaeraceae archaeon]
MTADKDILNEEVNEVINPDGSVIPEIEQQEQQSKTENGEGEFQNYSISKNNVPSFRKVLVTDDGKDISNKALNYAISLSNSTGAELIILRILNHLEHLKGVPEEDYNKNTEINQQNLHKNEEVIDALETKIKQCAESGCKNKISYKIRVGKADDEIANETNENNYDLLVLTTSHIDSWVRSLFSDARKIISNVNIPILIIQ